MILVGHVLDHVLDYISIGLVTRALLREGFFYLVNLSNNQVPLQTTSCFSVMSFNNGELSDNLIGHSLGLGVYDAAMLLKL